MKKAKQFKVNDKVFAKVKGYPAWPAKITAVNGKKYTVEFYGTGEIGSIKAEDLFYYLKHKHTLLKPSKRKDYNDALGQIEAAVNKEGTDGNEYPEDSLTDVSVASSTPSEKKGPKRKRSSSEKSELAQPAKKGRDKNDVDDSFSVQSPLISEDNENELVVTKEKDDALKQKVDSVTVTENIEKNKNFTEGDENRLDQTVTVKDKDGNIKKQIEPGVMAQNKDPPTEKIKGSEANSQKIMKTHNIECDAEKEATVPKKYVMTTKLISEYELQSFIEYAKHAKEHEATYKSQPEESRDDYPNHVFAVKLPSDEFVALKLHTKWPLSFKNEYERAVYDGEVAEKLLEMKKNIETGNLTLQDQPDAFLKKFMMNGKDIDVALHTELLKRKKAKTELLKVEAYFVEMDSKIKACLGLDKADTKQAIEYIHKLKDAELTGILFIKHPHVLELFRRLRRYVGNVDEWNLSEESLDKFTKDAEKIRCKAEEMWEKIKGLIEVPDSAPSFWAGFNDIVSNFRTHSKHLTEDQICYVHALPFTRKFFMDLYDESKNEDVTDRKQKEVGNTQGALDAL